MVNEWEMASVVRDTVGALGAIVSAAESFANDKFGGSFLGGGAWNDACGKKLASLTVSVVADGVAQYVNVYECNSVLEKIADDIGALIPIIEAARKELS